MTKPSANRTTRPSASPVTEDRLAALLLADYEAALQGVETAAESGIYPPVVRSYAENSLLRILKPASRPEDIRTIARFIRQQQPHEVTDAIALCLIDCFEEKNIPLTDPDSFAVHLKCHTFLAEFGPGIPELPRKLSGLFDLLIIACAEFPDPSWTLIVLNQLPSYSHDELLKKLYAYEAISEFKKRNMYCKLIKIIKDSAAENAPAPSKDRTP